MPAVDRMTISHAHWQPRLVRNPDPAAGPDGLGFGDIVHGYADLEQSIGTIILTEKGSVPLEPEKCTRLMPYIDRRPDIAIPNISREIFDALRIWEPRIIVERVAITQIDFAHFRFPVFWRAAGDVARTLRQTVVLLPGDRQPAGAPRAA
jgi:hypothetical protein